VLFGIRTIDRNLDWRNDLTLFRAAARTSPNSAFVRMKNGTFLMASGRMAEAARELEAAVAILPGYDVGVVAYMRLSYVYERLGNIQAGEEAIRRSLAINDQLPDSWARLGHLLELQGKADQASAAYRREGVLRAGAR
jgi:predicted Zn-dependent protease